MTINPLILQTMSQIGNNLLNLILEEKIDNPYLKAVLEPMMSTFVSGILNGASTQTMGQQTADVAGSEMISNKNNQAKMFEKMYETALSENAN